MVDTLLIAAAAELPREKRVELALVHNDSRYLPDELTPEEIARISYPTPNELRDKNKTVWLSNRDNQKTLTKIIRKAIKEGRLDFRIEEKIHKYIYEPPDTGFGSRDWAIGGHESSWKQVPDDHQGPQKCKTKIVEIILVRTCGLIKWMESKGISPEGSGLLMKWIAGDKEKPTNKSNVSKQEKREAVLKQWLDNQAKKGKPYKIGEWTKQKIWEELRKMDSDMFKAYTFNPGECPSTPKKFFEKQKFIEFLEG